MHPSFGILAGMGPRSTAPFIDLVVSECQRQYGARDDIDFPQFSRRSITSLPLAPLSLHGQTGGSAMNAVPIAAIRGDYLISTDPARLDIAAIHAYLTRSYWSPGIPLDTVARALHGSWCFGVYQGERQVGLARIITDGATFAYLCDVYVLEEHRGQGLAKWLMEVILAHPALQGLRRMTLVTRDGHRLYRRFGFQPLARPEGYMEIHRPNVYEARPEQEKPVGK